MAWAAVIGLVALVAFLLLNRRKAPDISLTTRGRAIADELAATVKRRRGENLARWLPIVSGLPVVDRDSTPHLHTPIYDCVSDAFELPCAHRSYDADFSETLIGMPFGRITETDLRDTLSNFAERSPEAAAFVDDGDCAYLIYTDTLLEPGAKVQRYVRTSPDAFMVFGWRSGMRGGAGADDPAFFVREVSSRPDIWRRRARALSSGWRSNPRYLLALHQCAHG